MKTSTTIIFLFFFNQVFSQTLIPDAVKIKTAFDKLSADKNNKKLQANYVFAFPSDTKTFFNVFQTDSFDQLYSDSYKYIDVLEKCATTFPKEVISKCVDIGKNLVGDADAVGQLQNISVELASKHLTIFTDKFKTLDIKSQDSLINFYADVENHNAYKIYQDLIDNLNSVGQTDISKKLETARTIRKKRHDH